MNIEHKENGNIILHANKDDLVYLNELEANDPDMFDTDSTMCEFFEEFIGNSEWDWTTPEAIEALTDAPILATFKYADDGGCPEVLEAYGFMDYQVISLQRQLLEHGQAELQKGK